MESVCTRRARLKRNRPVASPWYRSEPRARAVPAGVISGASVPAAAVCTCPRRIWDRGFVPRRPRTDTRSDGGGDPAVLRQTLVLSRVASPVRPALFGPIRSDLSRNGWGSDSEEPRDKGNSQPQPGQIRQVLKKVCPLNDIMVINDTLGMISIPNAQSE